ncbi:MAG: Xaa-Pro aminopeptidase, partial [Flavobacteriales bacterium]
TNEFIARWEGHKYTKAEATTASGIEKVYWLDDIDNILNELILLSENVYINTNENDGFKSRVPSRDIRFVKKLKERYPIHNYLRAQPILKQMAVIKSSHEIALLQQAINITDTAFKRVLEFVKPGVMEYEIEAEIIHQFIRNRANGHGYSPIVASGKNACTLHYLENNQQCVDGDILLMDFGAEYANYTADLSRSIPVNGRFSGRQRDVYEAVLKVMKEATQLLVPGTMIDDYQKEVGKIMTSELIGIGLLDQTDVKNQDPKRPLYKKYFMHSTSHHLGLDVHDLAHRYQPIQTGMVFTVEPGIYILEENLGIRIENNILVTEEGPVDLMANIPVEVEDIEEWMSKESVRFK